MVLNLSGLMQQIRASLSVDGQLFVHSRTARPTPLYDPVGAATDIAYFQNGDVIIERTDGISPQLKFKTSAFASQNGLIAFKDDSDDNQWTVQARSSNHATEPKEFSISNQYDGGAWYNPFVLMPEVVNRMFVLDQAGITLARAAGIQLHMESNCTSNSGTLVFKDTGDNEKWLFSARASDHATEAREFHITEHHTGSAWYDPLVILPQSPNNSFVIKPDGVHIGTELIVDAPTAPAAANSTGIKGQIAYDTSYMYVCTATDTWRRIAHNTW